MLGVASGRLTGTARNSDTWEMIEAKTEIG